MSCAEQIACPEQTVGAPDVFLSAFGEVEVPSGITRWEAGIMSDLLHREQAETTAEIGCANGASTVVIASALERNGRGHHYVVDPFQSRSWKNAGKKATTHVGLTHRVTFHDAFPEDVFPTLPELDFVFIDGSHRFDLTVLDFVLADKRLRPGGILSFHDTCMPSIRKVLRFILGNRAYEPLRLTSAPRSRVWSLMQSGRYGLARWVARIITGDADIVPSNPPFKQLGLDRANLVYIRKLRHDRRHWREFTDF